MTNLVQGLGKVIVQVHQQMIGRSGNLGRIRKSEKASFQMATETGKETMLFDDVTYSRSEFQRVGTATEKDESQHEFLPSPKKQTKSENQTNGALWTGK